MLITPKLNMAAWETQLRDVIGFRSQSSEPNFSNNFLFWKKKVTKFCLHFSRYSTIWCFIYSLTSCTALVVRR